MAKLTIREDLCKGCELCVSVCPKKLLSLNSETINHMGHFPVKIDDQEACIGCAFCATMCPDCVITVEK